jgi:replication-associated recombination protein RarA
MSGADFPSAFRPEWAADLIGPAGQAARALLAKARKMRAQGSAPPLKVLFYGPPGVGKTTVAELVARELSAGEACAIEDFHGREVTLDVVRRWMESLAYRPMFGRGWSVRIVNELDRCSREAQDLLLTYLDRLGSGRAFLATSNLQLDLLTERLQTRFQVWHLAAPTPDEIALWLATRWKVSESLAGRIAEGCGGCVRAALCDLESARDMELPQEGQRKKRKNQ